MIGMDEKVDKILRDTMGQEDYMMVIKMLGVIESPSKNVKEDIRKILEETVNG